MRPCPPQPAGWFWLGTRAQRARGACRVKRTFPCRVPGGGNCGSCVRSARDIPFGPCIPATCAGRARPQTPSRASSGLKWTSGRSCGRCTSGSGRVSHGIRSPGAFPGWPRYGSNGFRTRRPPAASPSAGLRSASRREYDRLSQRIRDNVPLLSPMPGSFASPWGRPWAPLGNACFGWRRILARLTLSTISKMAQSCGASMDEVIKGFVVATRFVEDVKRADVNRFAKVAG